jgi:hypothetical protein
MNRGYRRKFELSESQLLLRCRIPPSKSKDAVNSKVAMATPLAITLGVDGGPARSVTEASIPLYFG